MMTTMAALLGALPLALGSGVGSELRRPLGISIVGGLIFSQVLTLYTTPGDLSRLRPAGAAGPRRPSGKGKRRPGDGQAFHEHLGNLHQPAGRDHASHYRTGARRGDAFRLLPVSPLPHVDFPTIIGLGEPARSGPRDHGHLGRGAAGTPVRTIAGRDGDDLHQLPRLDEHRAAVRPQPQHRRGGPRRPGGDQCGPGIPAAEPPEQPDLPQSQSGGGAHSHHRPHLRHGEHGPDVRCGLEHHAAEAIPGEGGRPGVRGRKLPSRGPGGLEPHGVEQIRDQPGRRSRCSGQHQRQPAQGTAGGWTPGPGRSRPTTSSAPPSSTGPSS